MSDIDAHSNPNQNIELGHSHVMYGFSLFYCMPLSLNFPNGEGLGTMWGVELAQKMIAEAGFSNVTKLKGANPVFMHLLCRQ
jgi:hypothetical protein